MYLYIHIYMPCQKKNPQKVHGMPIPILSWSGLGTPKIRIQLLLPSPKKNGCNQHEKHWTMSAKAHPHLLLMLG
jgi:hypothetical protein